VVYVGGRGAHSLPLVGLPPSKWGAITPSSVGCEDTPIAAWKWGASGAGSGVRSPAEMGYPVPPTPSPSHQVVSPSHDEESNEGHSPAVVAQADRYIGAFPKLTKKRKHVLDAVAKLHTEHAAFVADMKIGKAIESRPDNPLGYLRSMS